MAVWGPGDENDAIDWDAPYGVTPSERDAIDAQRDQDAADAAEDAQAHDMADPVPAPDQTWSTLLVTLGLVALTLPILLAWRIGQALTTRTKVETS